MWLHSNFILFFIYYSFFFLSYYEVLFVYCGLLLLPRCNVLLLAILLVFLHIYGGLSDIFLVLFILFYSYADCEVYSP